MAKATKAASAAAEKTNERKELEQWQEHCKNLGFKEGEKHQYSDYLDMLEKRAIESEAAPE